MIVMFNFSIFVQSLSSDCSLTENLSVSCDLVPANELSSSEEDKESNSSTWCHPLNDLTPLIVVSFFTYFLVQIFLLATVPVRQLALLFQDTRRGVGLTVTFTIRVYIRVSRSTSSRNWQQGLPTGEGLIYRSDGLYVFTGSGNGNIPGSGGVDYTSSTRSLNRLGGNPRIGSLNKLGWQ